MNDRQLKNWLSSPDQPAARYRYLTEIQGMSPASKQARAARSAINRRGWGAEILGRQDPRGFWVARESLYRPKYSATNWNLLVLAELGADPSDPQLKRGLDLMCHDYAHGSKPFGKTGPHHCFTGNMARMMIRLGRSDHPGVAKSLDWLADSQEKDGGWDCFGRKKGTLDCWEALAAYAAYGVKRLTPKWKGAMERGAEFYLDRRLLREGSKRYAAWERIHYPVHYYYDFLLGLEILTSLGFGDDRRLAPALALLKKKRRPDRTWALDAIHPDLPAGNEYGSDKEVSGFIASAYRLSIEPPAAASKWTTLRALGVKKRVSR
jgi:hypothetical protein